MNKIVTVTQPTTPGVWQTRRYECGTIRLGDGGAVVMTNARQVSDGWGPSDPYPYLVLILGAGWEMIVHGGEMEP